MPIPRWVNLVVLFAFLLVVGVSYFRGKRKPRLSVEEVVKTPEGFARGMAEVASFAVNDAKNDFNIDLDYSAASVEHVENILGKLHEQHKQSEFSGKKLNKHALRYGIYIGEVIRKEYQGHWNVIELQKGDPMNFQISFKNHEGKNGTSFPVNWCGKRILNGAEDNVWHKYRVFVEGEEFVLTSPIQPSRQK